MRRFLWLLLGIAVAALVMPIGISNRQPVTVNLDLFGRTPSPFVADVPLSLLMFGLFMLGLLLGGLAAWLGQGRWRRTARAKSREAYQWKTEADRLARDSGSTGSAVAAVPPSSGRRKSWQMTRLANGR